jgi:hypothetical protein
VTDAPPPPAAGSGQFSENTASGNARVGAQYGFVTGDVHHYNVTEGQQPAERYAVAFRFLEGGASPRAAELIKEAVEARYRGGDETDDYDDKITANHIAFHWKLAVLSGKPLEHLTKDDFTAIRLARMLTNAASLDDQWLAGCILIDRLLGSLRRQERTGRPEPGLDRLLSGDPLLTDRCRDRIRRHLDVLLVAGQADQQDAYSAEYAIHSRMSDDRMNRAWKFFEPTPEEPRQRQPTEPHLTTGARLLCGAGAVLAVAAGVYWIVLIQNAGIWPAIAVAVGLLSGGAAAGPSAVSYLAVRQQIADRDRQHGYEQLRQGGRGGIAVEHDEALGDDADEEAEESERARARRKKFVQLVTDHIDKEFSRHAPRPSAARKKWHSDTAGLRKTLSDEILSLYHEPSVRLGSVNWLISYRVTEISQLWQAKKLADYRTQLHPSLRTIAGLSLGTIAFAVAACYGAVTMIILRPAEGVIAALAMIAAGLLVATSRADRYLVQQRTIRADEPERQERFRREMAEFRRRIDELLDRPGDEEIARWLDFDKIYLKTLAMNQLGLGRRDILQYATLIEPGPGWIGARVHFGPPRYSVYVVSVFLLTDAGVRQVTVTLDFLTGVAGNQIRRSFRHDAIASATVIEDGIRFDTGRRETMPSESQRDRRGSLRAIEGQGASQQFDASLILRQEIRLRLMSSEAIRFRVENFDADYIDPTIEDAASLLNIALDTSGITAVLELLEAISGHGAQWAAQQERRRRWRAESDPSDDEDPGG